jgi:transcriptional regulator with XRE-family HTH domain
MDNASIKNNIRKIRTSHNITQEEMAYRLGISVTAYRDFEKGKTSSMNSNILKMASILDTPTEALVLGYIPSEASGKKLEDVRKHYDSQVTVLERRISDLEKLVTSLEGQISSKDEIIKMLKKRLGEDE